MFKAYINRFMRGNQLINTEELMFSVPSSNGFPITRPVVKANEDSAENFSFTMETNSPYYNSLLPLKTIIRIEYGEDNNKDIIFNGRVLSIQTSSVYHTKNVVCAGYFSFLNDTYYEGVTENKRKKITLTEYINRIYSNHNTSATDKPISKGNIGVTLPSDSDYYEPTGWTQTSTLFSNLTNVYGGHLKVRYSGSTTYLDWYKYYARDLGNNRPSVTIGRNILDINSDTSADDIFTRVIPIGDTDSNGNTIYVDGYNGHSGKAISVTSVSYSDEFHNASDYTNAEANYGIIYKTVSFPEANTKEKLWNAAIKWIKDCYFGLVTSFTVKAVDMYITGESSNRILLGDCVNVTYTINQNGTINTYTRKLICKSVSYDLFNPENNSYTFGFPTDLLENNKDRKKSSKKKDLSEATAPKSTVRSGGDSGPWTWIKVWHMIGERDGNHDYEGTNAATSFYNNGEMATVVTCYDPEEIKANLPQDYDTPGTRINILIDDHQYLVNDVEKRSFKAKTIGRISLSDKPIKWVAISEDRGIFAYISNRGINSVSYWYIKKKVKYDGIEAGKTEGVSTFEAIAQMIEKDTDGTWGGLSNANSFRSAGKVSGSIQKVYDPQEYASAANAKEDPNGLFSGDLVGRLGKTSNKYVAISKEYGIFGFTAGRSSTGVLPVGHWYMRGKGIVYDNVRGIFIDENGMYLTDDGDPDSNKTFVLDGDTGNIQDANGKVQLGYDTTQPGDLWQVELNVPITYTDKDGNVVTLDHFVKASDINLPSIPSFKTKIAVADAIIAGKVNAVDLAAERAYIKKLRGDTIVAGVSVYAEALRGHLLRGDDVVVNVTGNSQNPGGGFSLKDAVKSAYFYPGIGPSGTTDNEKGKIYLVLTKADGSALPAINFNIADTAAYQEAVSAAKSEGWNGARSNIINSLPTSSTERSSIDGSNWVLKIPNSGFNSGATDYPISVSNVEEYQPQGTTTKIPIIKVKINGYTVYIKDLTTYKNTVEQAGEETGYENGWRDAKGRSSTPTEAIRATSTSNTITVSLPKTYGATNYDTTSDTYTYTLATDTYQPSTDSGDVKCIVLKYGNNVVARINNPYVYTSSEYTTYGSTQYSSGWTAAKAKASTPTTAINANSTSSTITVKMPKTYGATDYSTKSDEYTYTLDTSTYQPSGTTSSNVKCIVLKYGSNVVARINNPYVYTSSEYTTYGSTRYNAGWDDHLNHTYAWFETSDSPCEQNYAMAAGKYYRIFYIKSNGQRVIGQDNVNGSMKYISWGPVPSGSSGPGTITLPTASMGTSDNPSSTYARVETLGKKAKAAYGDYEWVIFKINCSCGAHKYVAFDPHQS